MCQITTVENRHNSLFRSLALPGCVVNQYFCRLASLWTFRASVETDGVKTDEVLQLWKSLFHPRVIEHLREHTFLAAFRSPHKLRWVTEYSRDKDSVEVHAGVESCIRGRVPKG